jgi:hypothetical protein
MSLRSSGLRYCNFCTAYDASTIDLRPDLYMADPCVLPADVIAAVNRMEMLNHG